MSVSDHSTGTAMDTLLTQLETVVDDILEKATHLDEKQASDAVKLLALAARYYGGISRTEGAEDMPMGIPATTTDAATAAAVLIISQNLSLFEFNIWYSRVADAAERQQQGRATQ